MKFKKKYTDEELIKFYEDFKKSKLSSSAFIKKTKIGSSTFYRALYVHENKQKLLESSAHSDTNKDALKECQFLDFNNLKTQIFKDNLQTQALLTKYTIILVAAQAAFTIITLIFLS